MCRGQRNALGMRLSNPIPTKIQNLGNDCKVCKQQGLAWHIQQCCVTTDPDQNCGEPRTRKCKKDTLQCCAEGNATHLEWDLSAQFLRKYKILEMIGKYTRNKDCRLLFCYKRENLRFTSFEQLVDHGSLASSQLVMWRLKLLCSVLDVLNIFVISLNHDKFFNFHTKRQLFLWHAQEIQEVDNRRVELF